MEGLRLDKYVTLKLEGVSRSKVQSMIKDGGVLVNGKKSKASHVLTAADSVHIKEFDNSEKSLVAEDLDLEILHEDKDCLVINKPVGMVVHPGDGGTYLTGTVANAVMSKVDAGVGEPMRPGIVHRLDKDTSGILLIAKTQEAYENFVDQFKTRKVEKHYLALVWGQMEHVEGIIDSPMGRSVNDRKKMAVSRQGKPAITQYKVKKLCELADEKLVSLLDVEIFTGRTHQIRVHMAAIDHPVVMDDIYGDRRRNKKFFEAYRLRRQFLHAWKLSFVSPSSGEKLNITAEIPEDLETILSSLQVLS